MRKCLFLGLVFLILKKKKNKKKKKNQKNQHYPETLACL